MEMATQTTTTLVDDLDGSPAADTYVFGLDGTWYEIDLNEKNAKKLTDALSVFVAAGRRGEAGRMTPDREQTTAIRNWARSQGLTVSDRGRLSQSIIDQFEAAH
jgi:hypothetical protein